MTQPQIPDPSIPREDCKLISCVLPDDGSDKKLLQALLHEKQITRTKSVSCLGLAVLAEARTKYGELPEPTMVRLVEVIVPAALADELYDYIYHQANIARAGGGTLLLGPLMAASPHALPDDVPDEKA
jgi:hypothetical protein